MTRFSRSTSSGATEGPLHPGGAIRQRHSWAHAIGYFEISGQIEEVANHGSDPSESYRADVSTRFGSLDVVGSEVKPPNRATQSVETDIGWSYRVVFDATETIRRTALN